MRCRGAVEQQERRIAQSDSAMDLALAACGAALGFAVAALVDACPSPRACGGWVKVALNLRDDVVSVSVPARAGDAEAECYHGVLRCVEMGAQERGREEGVDVVCVVVHVCCEGGVGEELRGAVEEDDGDGELGCVVLQAREVGECVGAARARGLDAR